MSETGKTAAFWLVAAIAAVSAMVVAWPQRMDDDNRKLIGTALFEKFADVLAVASLRIDRFDEELGQLSSFGVTRDKKTGQWSIPTHNGYPANAADQVRDAATAFLDLKILDIASEVREDHKKFGVLEPNAGSLKLGDEGVGRLVVFENDSGEDLVNLIIGKTVKDNDAQRFVRIPTQDLTYVVRFDDRALSTRFGDWIDENLLGLNAFDVQQVTIRDYSIVRTMQDQKINASIQRNFHASVSVADNGEWTLQELTVFEKNKPVEKAVDENTVINQANLSTLRGALEDLKIIDVRRKPDGLSAELKADANFMNDQAAVESLIGMGFYPREEADGEVLAANGELILTLDGGVEYLLRFGDIDRKMLETVSSTDERNDDATGLNRYLMVSARVNQDRIPQPEIVPVPKSWDELHAAAPTNDAEPGPDGAVVDPPNTQPQLTDEEKQEELEIAQERARKSNQRAEDELADRVEQANRRVRALNERFADWYYVVPESEYRKVHLSREDLVAKSKTNEEAQTADTPETQTPDTSATDTPKDAETPQAADASKAEPSPSGSE